MREHKHCSAIGGALFWSTTTGEQGPTESFPSGPPSFAEVLINSGRRRASFLK